MKAVQSQKYFKENQWMKIHKVLGLNEFYVNTKKMNMKMVMI